MNPYISFQFIAASMGFVAVSLGAFGAHGLKSTFSDYEIGIWETATQYLMFHTLVMLFLTLLPKSKKIKYALVSTMIGNIIFPGSLYLLALTGNKILGAVTPVGGLAYLIGWAILAYHLFKQATFTPKNKLD